MTTIAMIALMFVAFYFLILRPQKKRQEQQRKTLNALEPGARVLTSTGVYAKLLRIGEKQAVLELSPGHEMTIVKHAIVRAVQPGDEDLEMESEDFHDADDASHDVTSGEAADYDPENRDSFPWADRDGESHKPGA